MDNIYIRFGTKLYRQSVGIPMGTNCAPLVADLFLFCYKRDFMKDLSSDNQADVIKDTDFCLLACGGHPLSPPINSPDNTAHIKGITYLSDYVVIMVCLGGAKKRAIRY